MIATLEKNTVDEKLKSHFGENIVLSEMLYDMQCVTVKQDIIHQVVKFLYDDAALQFQFLTTLCGMHFPDGENKFGLVIQLHSLIHNYRLRLKTFTNHEPPTFPTFTDIFSGANWMERETYDFFGFKFTGHPNLKRILNVDDMEGFPMRKEFPLEDQARFDKDDKMFGR